jgi:hypothetical protein
MGGSMTDAIYRTNPSRELLEVEGGPDGNNEGRGTTIFVRALKVSTGRFESVDICELDRPSLQAWLRSRGGSNEWAESVVLILLGHEPENRVP